MITLNLTTAYALGAITGWFATLGALAFGAAAGRKAGRKAARKILDQEPR